MFEHGETLRLQFPKEDLGYVYSQGAGGVNCVGGWVVGVSGWMWVGRPSVVGWIVRWVGGCG